MTGSSVHGNTQKDWLSLQLCYVEYVEVFFFPPNPFDESKLGTRRRKSPDCSEFLRDYYKLLCGRVLWRVEKAFRIMVVVT